MSHGSPDDEGHDDRSAGDGDGDVEGEVGGDGDVEGETDGDAGEESTVTPGTGGNPARGAGSADGTEEDSEVTEVGDGREKHIEVVTELGRSEEHAGVYVRHSETEFLVSSDREFPASETTRYRKADVRRVEISQHHSACFITTAAAGEGTTLEALRGFREDAMRPAASGRPLLAVYDRLSPPIAATLSRHPRAGPTRAVRWLVDRCGDLAARRSRANGRTRAALSVLLTLLYVLGVCLALGAHVALRTRELVEAEKR